VETLTPRALNRALLARQMLLRREKATATEAIHRLVALQAQVARPPFVGLWTRVAGFRRADLLRAIRAREVVRVTAMRATLHLMTAADYVALRSALQPALGRILQNVLGKRAGSLDAAQLETLGRDFFGKAPATFEALRKAIKKRDAKADERAVAYAIRTHVPLVQVCTDADPWGYPASCDFALADTWLSRKVPFAEAPAHELVRRYLAAFGPATPQDAQTWSGLQKLKDVFEELRPSLVAFRAGKREVFDLPDAPRPPEDTPAPVRFVPDFDNLVLSHADRTHVIDDAHRPRIVTKNLLVRATVLVDGRVGATWTSERRRNAARLVVEPFGPLPKKVRAEIEQEGDALLAFLEEDANTREVVFAR
jgi:hypothetical protein